MNSHSWRAPLQRTSTEYSRASPNNECFMFTTFKDCEYGGECKRGHPTKYCYEQEFFIGTIFVQPMWSNEEITVQRYFSRKRESFHVVDNYQILPKRNDIVIFQASCRYDRYDLKYGRVLAILGRNVPVRKNIAVEPLQMGAFTIDYPGTRCRDQAMTIEHCRIHGNCKEIGIHVAAAAAYTAERCRSTDLRYYMSRSTMFKKAGWSMDSGKIIPAISVFVHTNNEATIGPVFTPVKVEANYTFHDRKKYQTQMSILWSHFTEDSLVHMLDALQYYILDSPRDWKDILLSECITATFNEIVTKSVVERTNHYFITNQHLVPPDKRDEIDIITVFKDRITDVENVSPSADVKDKMLRFLSAGEISQHQTRRLFDNFQPFKYQRDVERSDQIVLSRTVVKNTCPLRNIHQFVNQQVLIRCMIGSEEKMYTREDLLGILGVRFKTPVLARPFVLEACEDAVILRYPSDMRCDGSLYEVDPKLLTNDGGNCSLSDERWKIWLERISCPSKDLCNRALVHFDRPTIEKIREKFADGVGNPKDIKNVFRELSKSKTEEDSPYRTKENGILLILQRGAELQLQISNEDAENHNDLGLRLLRIGKNCHLCLTHINQPEKAFMSDREDIRKLLKPEHIAAMKETRKLEALRLRDVTVTWDDDYFSGGNFEPEPQAKKEICRVGDLLCIRQEVFHKEGHVQYVWVCHAIVSDIVERRIMFSVCTLSQTRSDVAGNGFCVEVMKNAPAEESASTDERD